MCEMKKKDSQVVDFDIDGCFVEPNYRYACISYEQP